MKLGSMWGMAMSMMGLALSASGQENIGYEVHAGPARQAAFGCDRAL
jgi:hypothetical protein